MRKTTVIYAILIYSIVFIGYTTYMLNSSKKKLERKTISLLKEAIDTYVGKESSYYYIDYQHDPSKLGQYKEKTVQLPDTTFKIKSKIVDIKTHIHRGIQTLLLETGKLSADTLNLVFDSLCQVHNIYAKSAISIQASFHKKINLLSRDTTNLTFTHYAAVYGQGEYEDINYYSYLKATPYTYWQLFPKSALSIGLALWFILIGFIIKKRKNNIDIPVENKESDSELSIEPSIDINIKRFTKQQKQILEMFLQSPKHCVEKEKIKLKFWPNHINATSNMTTAIKRVRLELEKESGYTINVYNEDKDYYILEKNVLKPRN